MCKFLKLLPLLLFLLIMPAITGFNGENNNNLKFAFLTDLHVSPGNKNEAHLSMVVDEINQSDVELVIITGDISNTGSNAELLTIKNILDKLTKPYLIIPGNHETNWSESAGLKINELWGDDRFISEWKNFVLVGFNTGPYMKMGDGHVKQEDLQWLKKELASRMTKNKKLLSFAHYPLADGLDNWFEVTTILKSFNCQADFCGHEHRLGLLNFDGIAGIMGRSLVLNDPSSAGYNIVEIKNGSIYVSEKLLGKNVETPAITLSLKNLSEIEGLPISSKPDYSVNDKFQNIKETYQWADTASIFSGMCLVADSMFIYGNSLGWLKAINYKKNKILWQTNFQGAIYSTPVVYNNVVVFGAINGIIYGVNMLTGKILWQVNAGTPVLASPIREDNNVYIGGGNSAFYSINMLTGEVNWTFNGVDGLVQGKPVLYEDMVIFGAWDRHLYCVSASTGELIWKWNNNKPQLLYSPGNIVPVVSNNKVFIVAPDRFMTAINLATGNEVWRTNKHKVRESMGISPDGREVFAKLMNDSIISVSAIGETFKTNWTVDAGIKYDHNPCPLVANRDLVIGATKNGVITAINRKNHTIEWMHKTGNSSVNLMALDGDRSVWISSMEGKIIRISFK